MEERGLIHGLYNRPDVVLARFKAFYTKMDINFGEFSWVGSERAPDFDPADPETVVVLDATFGSLFDTYCYAMARITGPNSVHSPFDGHTGLRLLSDNREDNAKDESPDFKPFTLRWVRIRINTYACRNPFEVRDPKASPGFAALFMVAEHPDRFKVVDEEQRFGLWIPGLKVTDREKSQSPWGCILLLYFSSNFGTEINSYPNIRSRYSRTIIPTFRE